MVKVDYFFLTVFMFDFTFDRLYYKVSAIKLSLMILHSYLSWGQTFQINKRNSVIWMNFVVIVGVSKGQRQKALLFEIGF